jgi:hypothetical protein
MLESMHWQSDALTTRLDLNKKGVSQQTGTVDTGIRIYLEERISSFWLDLDLKHKVLYGFGFQGVSSFHGNI